MVLSVTFSPDGAHLASGSKDRTVRLWDLNNTVAAAVLKKHEDCVFSLAFSPDGTRLASGSGDHTILMWDPRQPSNPALVRKYDNVRSSPHSPLIWPLLAFSPDGARLASESQDKTIRLWDLHQPDARPQILEAKNTILTLAYSPDGTLIAAMGKFESRANFNPFYANPFVNPAAPVDKLVGILLWDLRRPTTAPPILNGSEKSSSEVAISPDGKHLASGSPDNNKILLWNLREPSAPPLILKSENVAINSLVFSPDSTRLASKGLDADSLEKGVSVYETIQFWDLRQPNATPQILSGGGQVYSLAFASDSRHLALCGSGTIRVRDLLKPDAPGLILRTPRNVKSHDEFFHWVETLAFSRDGTRLVASVGEEGVLLWDLRQPSATPLVVSKGEEKPVAFSPDGTRLASSDGKTIHIWDLWTRAADHLCTMVGHNLSMDEWNLNVGEAIPYERTCKNLPPGAGAP